MEGFIQTVVNPSMHVDVSLFLLSFSLAQNKLHYFYVIQPLPDTEKR